MLWSLLSSPRREVNILVRVVAKEIKSTTAKNIRLLDKETSGLTWEAASWKIREVIGSREVNVEDRRRIPYLGKL